MQLRWTEEAFADLERIANYFFEQTPNTAAELLLQIYKAPEALLTFPNRGRKGKKLGTRELVMTSLPYLIVYAVIGTLSTSLESCMPHKIGTEMV